MIACEMLDTALADRVTDAVRAPGARHPECGSHPDISTEIKPATKRGGVRPGAGRPCTAPAVAVLAPGWAGPRWFCVEVHRRCEDAVVEQLQDLGFEAIAPQSLDSVPARGKRPAQEILRPAFPGYVIVEFDRADAGWRRIASQPGVRRIMGSHPERPMALRDVQVAWIIGQFGFGGAQRVPVQQREAVPAPLAEGVEVRVISGPLDGMHGRVMTSNGLAVVLALAGRRVRMAQAAVTLAGPPQDQDYAGGKRADVF